MINKVLSIYLSVTVCYKTLPIKVIRRESNGRYTKNLYQAELSLEFEPINQTRIVFSTRLIDLYVFAHQTLSNGFRCFHLSNIEMGDVVVCFIFLTMVSLLTYKCYVTL